MSSTVILGAGIIGVSTAYYLSNHQSPSTIHLVDPSPELFASASGFAGGFLAKDWFSSATASLGRLSYEEHRKLADKFGGREKWGYSTTTSLSYVPAPPRGSRSSRRGGGDDGRPMGEGTSRAGAAPSMVVEELAGTAPAWLKRKEGDHIEVIVDDGSTAQV